MGWEEQMGNMYRRLEKLPTPALPVEEPKPLCCSGCRKPISSDEIRYHNTGVCIAVDMLCNECQLKVPKHAYVVCVGCKAVVARMAPERLKSGFNIEARRIYHTDGCPNCRFGITTSSIIEAELFFKARH